MVSDIAYIDGMWSRLLPLTVASITGCDEYGVMFLGLLVMGKERTFHPCAEQVRYFQEISSFDVR